MKKIEKNGLKSKALPQTFVALATENEKQGKKWDGLKMQNLNLGEAYQSINTRPNLRFSHRLQDCSKFLEFEQGGDKWRLSKASFCNVRLCPVCQWRKSLVWQKRFSEALPKLEQAQPKARFLFLTLTIRNCEVQDTRQTLKHLQQSLNRMVKLKDWPAVGWVRTFEITRNATGNTAHPHIHLLLMVKPSYFSHGYLTHEKWGQIWQQCLRVDYVPQVNVKVVKPKEGTTLNPLFSALLEVFKYSVKPSDLYECPEFLDTITRQLKGVRSVGLGGLFKELIKDNDEDLHELEGVEIENPQKLLYNFYPVWEQYARKK